eukprot:901594_1
MKKCDGSLDFNRSTQFRFYYQQSNRDKLEWQDIHKRERDPNLDSDGDLIICRRQKNSDPFDKLNMEVQPDFTVSITYSTESSINSVGTQLWRAAFVLTDLVVSMRAYISGATVLELGCGVGLVGVVASRLGAGTVFATDGPLDVLNLCARNVRMNARRSDDSDMNSGAMSKSTTIPNIPIESSCVKVRQLDWTFPFSHSRSPKPESSNNLNDRTVSSEIHTICVDSPSSLQPENPLKDESTYKLDDFGWSAADLKELKNVSVILASDVAYDDFLSEKFVATLRRVFEMTTVTECACFIAVEKRVNFTLENMYPTADSFDYLLTLLLAGGFVVRTLDLDTLSQRSKYSRGDHLVVLKTSDVLDTWVKLTSKSDGRDKFNKLIQYGARYLAYRHLSVDPKDPTGLKLRKLFVTVANARKLDRLFN